MQFITVEFYFNTTLNFYLSKNRAQVRIYKFAC